MEYTIKAIPTIYNGIQFRSRLEAKWARFFDLVGWKWEYEPFDLNGWIPDFMLIGHSEQILVEVKPVIEYPSETIAEIVSTLSQTPQNTEVLVLGCTIQELDLGWLLEFYGVYEGEPVFSESDAVLGVWEGSERDTDYPRNTLGFCSSTHSFHDRMSGRYDGGCHGSGLPYPQRIRQAWRSAANATQWRGKQSVTRS